MHGSPASTDTTRRARRAWAAGLAGALALAAALRVPPLHLHVPGPDLQEAYARQAMLALTEGSWTPAWSGHGPGFFTLLRGLFTVWYALGWLGGWWADRIDMLAAFLGRPYPFLLAARLVVLTSALATVALVAWLGRATFGRAAGLAAAVALAVMYTHVRESLQVWPDVPAAALALAAVAATVHGRRHGLAALLAGAAVATKHSAAPVLLPVAVAALGATTGRWRRLALAAVGSAAGYLALAPTTLVSPQPVLEFLRMQAVASFGIDVQGLSLGRIVAIGAGWPLAALTGIGVVAALAAPGRARTLLLLAFPVAYLLAIAGAGRVFARYLALASPFVALFAGHGLAVLVAAAGRARRTLMVLGLAAACALPLWRSFVYVRAMSRPDTRVLAGEWLAQHAWPDAIVVLPNALAAPHPAIPGVASPRLGDAQASKPIINAAKMRLAAWGAPRLELRTLGVLGRFGTVRFGEAALVVTATHPVVLHEPEFDHRVRMALASLGAHPVARFAPMPDPPPPGVVFDPLDADYVPLLGAGALERPGPDITVWDVQPPPPVLRRPAWKR